MPGVGVEGEGIMGNAIKITYEIINVFLEPREILEGWQCQPEEIKDKIIDDIKWIVADALMVSSKETEEMLRRVTII